MIRSHRKLGSSRSVPRSVKVLALRVALAAFAVPLVACTSPGPSAGGPTPVSKPAAPAGGGILEQAAELARAPHDSVKSSDGRAELILLPGSLPAGIALSNIKVTKLIPAEASLRFGGQPPLIAYRLDPDGLEFETQPFLRMSTDLPPDGRVPGLFTDGRGGVSRLTAVGTEVNIQNRQVTLTAQLAHFSQLVVAEGAFTVTLSELQDHVWGAPFEMKAVIARAARTDPVTRKGGEKVDQSTARVLLSGLWLPAGLRPTIVDNAPPPTALLPSSTFTVAQTFSCRTQGSIEVRYEAFLQFPDLPGSAGKGWSEIVVDSESRKCLGPLSAISASFNQSEFSTTYSIQVTKVPALGAANWGGTDCGTTLGLPDASISASVKEVSFQWRHPHPPCDPTTDHASVVVSARFYALDDPFSYWLCNYQGAASGKGKPCTYFGSN